MINLDGPIEAVRELVDRFIAEQCVCDLHRVRPDLGLRPVDEITGAFVAWVESIEPAPEIWVTSESRLGIPETKATVELSPLLLVTVAESVVLARAGRMRTRRREMDDGSFEWFHVVDIEVRQSERADTAEVGRPAGGTDAPAAGASEGTGSMGVGS